MEVVGGTRAHHEHRYNHRHAYFVLRHRHIIGGCYIIRSTTGVAAGDMYAVRIVLLQQFKYPQRRCTALRESHYADCIHSQVAGGCCGLQHTVNSGTRRQQHIHGITRRKFAVQVRMNPVARHAVADVVGHNQHIIVPQKTLLARAAGRGHLIVGGYRVVRQQNDSFGVFGHIDLTRQCQTVAVLVNRGVVQHMLQHAAFLCRGCRLLTG